MKRCLIADPSEIIRKVARHFLEGVGFEVIEAEAASEALEICKHRAPDIIMLDWHLPEMTTRRIPVGAALLGRGAKRPFVIYCTTDNDPADIARASRRRRRRLSHQAVRSRHRSSAHSPRAASRPDEDSPRVRRHADLGGIASASAAA